MHAELLGEAHDDHQAGISAATFDAAKIRHVDLSIAREFFLTEATSFPQLENIAPDDCPPVHRETERDNDYSHQGL